jgi:galactose-1-phosphate uridylyltransferase
MVAGFEWGTGFYINPTPPEMAATLLRESIEHNIPIDIDENEEINKSQK